MDYSRAWLASGTAATPKVSPLGIFNGFKVNGHQFDVLKIAPDTKWHEIYAQTFPHPVALDSIAVRFCCLAAHNASTQLCKNSPALGPGRVRLGLAMGRKERLGFSACPRSLTRIVALSVAVAVVVAFVVVFSVAVAVDVVVAVALNVAVAVVVPFSFSVPFSVCFAFPFPFPFPLPLSFPVMLTFSL